MKKFLILGIVAVALTACTDTKVPFLSSKSNNTDSSSSSSSTSVFGSLKEQLNGREFIIVTEGYNSKTSIGFKGDRVGLTITLQMEVMRVFHQLERDVLRLEGYVFICVG